VAPADAYYGTGIALQELATKGILELTSEDLTDTAATIAALDGAALLWIESPSNPRMGICDIEKLAQAAHDRGATVVVDNTFATPLLQKPLELGADIVVHSATKFISGHSDLIMGVACTNDSRWFDSLHDRRTHGGAIAGPMEAYLALRGLRTLPVRLEKAQASALELARRLEDHPRVQLVLYPGLPSHPQHDLAGKQMSGFGAMLSFLVEGDGDETDRVCDSTQIIANMTSLGGIETTMERRARHPGEKAPENLIRMSVGCENVEDLWRDLNSSLG
jgi:cystathionine gamma-synthase